MPIVWKKITVPATTAEDHPQQTLLRCELPILEQVIVSLPNLPTVGVRLLTPKQQIFPSPKFGGDVFVYGGGVAPFVWREDIILDGRPYDVTIETINGEATSQVVQVGLALSDEERSETDLLWEILQELREQKMIASVSG